MRWRAIGFHSYIRRFGISLLAFAAAFAVLGVLIVRRDPAPYHPPVGTILFMVGLGLALRLALELVPANISLTRVRLTRRSGVANNSWELADYASLRCTSINGVLRVELDGAKRRCRRRASPIVVAAPLKKEDDIEKLILASMRLRALEG